MKQLTKKKIYPKRIETKEKTQGRGIHVLKVWVMSTGYIQIYKMKYYSYYFRKK